TRFLDFISNDGVVQPVPCDPEKDVAQLQYTGGTTGTPKGAMLTHQNISANARQINCIDPHSHANMPDAPADDRILGVLPFFHVFANATVLNRTIDNGGEIVMLPRFEATAALKAVNRTKVTSMPGVPTMYQALLDNAELPKTEFSSLRACISGGAPLAAELKARFEGVSHAAVIEGYGLTESSGVISCNPYEGTNKVGSIGQPIPGTLVRLADKEDPSKPAPPGEPGELLAKGPQIMAGYWNKPEATAEVFVDGWLRTGDVATIDEDGFIFIVDRLKDMIAVGGFKVFPSQVEDILYKHPAVKEALVIGVPDSYSGERPKAYVTLNDGQAISGEELANWLNPQLGKHERVLAVVVRDALPKTMIGKLDRKALRAEEGV
ncbi:MAG: AMP-binding protein, partial [Sphingorhabdus sp.]|nr:AMP-binding protein [Sphingorhabdus sp.]